MAKNYTVSLDQIDNNTYIWLRGKLTFSRLSHKLEGEELAKDNQRRIAKGWRPIDKPYTTATIANAQVEYANPNAKTPAEIYIEEHMYTSQVNPGLCYTANNKGNNLPSVGELQADGVTISPIHMTPGQELANGLDVRLLLRVFQGKPNKGITLDGVVVNEPIRFFGNGASLNDALSQRGFVFAETEPADPTPVDQAQTPVNAPQGNLNFAQPETQPQAAPTFAQAQPQTNPFQAQPQQDTPAFSQQQNPFAHAPIPGQNAAPQPQAQPQVQPQAGGIQYNPDDDNRGGYV